MLEKKLYSTLYLFSEKKKNELSNSNAVNAAG